MLPVKYKNLVTGITDDGQWYTYWYMPYSSHAHVQGGERQRRARSP